MLEIRNVSKTYPGARKFAIKDINLEIDNGDIFGFIGPNNFQGEILFDGVSLKDTPIEFKKDIAYIPDNPILYEHLSGLEYINFVLNIYGIKDDVTDKINKYTEEFDLNDRIQDPISSYSHGMMQKVSIIAALLHNPKLLVLDEPFVGLDPKATFELKELLKRKCEEEGLTVFFSSHVLDVVEKFCNKIAIIKDGEIISSGLTNEVKGEGSLEDKFMEIFND